MKNIIQSLFATALCIIALFFTGCNSNNKYSEIVFPLAGEESLISDDIICSYDVKTLEEQIKNVDAYVFFDPIRMDKEELIKKIGIEIPDSEKKNMSQAKYSYPRFTDEEKSNGTVNHTENITIDCFGGFTYTTGAEPTTFEYPFSTDESIEIAKKWLTEHQLWSSILTKWQKHELAREESNNERIVEGVTISFSSSLNGTEICGNSHISVTLNGNGEVLNVDSNMRSFSGSEKADLIPVKDAINEIKEGNVPLYFEGTRRISKLNIERLTVKYYSQYGSSDTDCILQPIYVFEGTAAYDDNTEEPLYCYVQANKQ